MDASSVMPLSSVLGCIHCDDDTEQHSAHEKGHKRRSHHVATVALIISALPRGGLYIALLAVDMRFRSEDACNSLRKGLARRGVEDCMLVFVFVAVRLEFYVFLGYSSIL